jgi:hypothetical protein
MEELKERTETSAKFGYKADGTTDSNAAVVRQQSSFPPSENCWNYHV